ncbi:MAG: hypothetical protein ACYDHU_08400 [Acidimicrobiales bacterium]
MRFPRRSVTGDRPVSNGTGEATELDALLRLRAGTAVPSGADGGSPSIRTRLARLAAGVDDSHRRQGGTRDVQKIMNILGALVIGLGIVAVVLGWYGASHSPYLYQEIPYLISGGLLGVALVMAGSAAFLGSWMLRQVQESRSDTRAVVAAIERLERAAGDVQRPSPRPGAAPGPHAGAVAR